MSISFGQRLCIRRPPETPLYEEASYVHDVVQSVDGVKTVVRAKVNVDVATFAPTKSTLVCRIKGRTSTWEIRGPQSWRERRGSDKATN